MADKFFGIDIQAEVASAMPASDLPNYILTKRAIGVRLPDRPTAGTNPTSPVTYPVWGARTVFSLDDAVGAQQVQLGDLKFILIAKPLADLGVEVALADTITEGTKVYTVVSARMDAASSVWICQCR